MYFDELEVGMTASASKYITDEDIEMFAKLSGDYNPLHFNDDYASKTVFAGRIAHGLISASLLSGVLGMQLPGEGALWIEQHIKFLAPVRPGDFVVAAVKIIEKTAKGRRVTLSSYVYVDDKKVIDGYSIVSVPKRPVAVELPVEAYVGMSAFSILPA